MLRSTLLLVTFAIAGTGCGKQPASGTKDAPTGSGVPSPNDTALTAEHDPDMTGKTRRYDWTDYQPDGAVFKKVRFIETYTPDGKRRHRDEKHKAETVEDYKRQVKGGEVRHGVPYQGGLAWLPHVKVGAKPGETWEFIPPKGAKVRWTYKEVASDRGRPCALIVEEYLDGDTVQESWTRWYVRGEGVVRQEFRRRTKSGSFVLDRAFVYDPAEAPGDSQSNSSAGRGGGGGQMQGNEGPGRKEASRLPPASELTRLKRHEFVVYYKGFSEDQMAAYLDHLHKYYGQGSVQFRTGGVFSHMPKLAAADKGMHVIREDGFTRILLPVDEQRAKPTSPYFGNVAVPLCHSLIKIDESVRGKVVYAICDDDCKTIYQRSTGFDR